MRIIVLVALIYEVVANRTLTFAFGSCFKFYRSQQTDVFKRIGNHNPEFFIWLGDAAYLDIMIRPGVFIHDSSNESITQKFSYTKDDPHYKNFSAVTQIYGIYDDHDYGLNNGDMNNPIKAEVLQQYLDFLDFPKDHPLRKQEGLYQSYMISQKIKLILIDNRYSYNKKSGDLLGDQQWQWLENQFSDGDGDVELFIMGSGIQFLPDDRFIPESWPTQSKDRLFDMISKYKSHVIFISGDVHQGEILVHPCSQQKYGRTIIEFGSSGLNFANGDQYLFYDFVSQFVFPNYYNNQSMRFYKKNYGIIEIELSDDGSPLAVQFSLYHSGTSTLQLQRRVIVSELQGSVPEQSAECVLDTIPAWDRYVGNIRQAVRNNIVDVVLLALSVLVIFGLSLSFWVWWVREAWRVYKKRYPLY